MNTPDKVEEIVEEYDKTFGEWCPIYKKVRMPLTQTDWLRTTLTQYHQDLMSEVVWNMGAKIEEANFAEKVAERTGDATAVYEVQEVVKQIQTIIKSK